jgi:flagellar capping protein FliD
MNTSSTEAKVFQLSKELDEMRKRKKDFVKAYNEEIKRINSEIKDLLNPSDKIDLP